MKKNFKKSLAFLLAFALSFGELLPVRAAELTEPIVMTEETDGESTEGAQGTVEPVTEEQQQNPEKVTDESGESTETQTPETEKSETEDDLSTEASEKLPGEASETEASEIEATEAEASKSEVEATTGGEKTPEDKEELTQQSEVQQNESGQYSTITLSSGETTIPVEVDDYATCTPAKTGYYRAVGHNAGVGQWNNIKYGWNVPYIPIPPSDGNDFSYSGEQNLYYFEKGENYDTYFSRTPGLGDDEDAFVTITYIANKDLPQYTNMKADNVYKIPAGERGLFKILSPDSEVYFGIEGASAEEGSTLRADNGNIRALGLDREDGMQWNILESNGTNDYIYIVVPASQREQTVKYTNDLGIYEVIDQWKGEITLEAGERKYFEFPVEQRGDYLIRMTDNTVVEMGNSSYLQHDLMIKGKKYAQFHLGYSYGDVNSEVRFSVINNSQAQVVLGLVTDENIEKEELVAGKAASGENPYFSFTVPETGFYSIKSIIDGTESDASPYLFGKWREDYHEDQYGHSSYIWEFGEFGLLLQKGDVLTGFSGVYTYDGNENKVSYIVSKVEPIEKSGTEFTVEGENTAIYKFTPSRSGRCWATLGFRYYEGLSGQGNSSAWERRDGQGSYYLDVKKGKDYYIYFYPGWTVDRVIFGMDKQTTILDYDYYNAFIASGGSVSIAEDGTVITEGTMSIKGEKGKITATPLEIAGTVFYDSGFAEDFAAGNLYWKVPKVGEFSARNFYSLPGQDEDPNNPKKIQSTQAVQEGDVVLVEYCPEIVWAQSISLDVPAVTMEPGGTMLLTPVPDYKTGGKYRPEDTAHGATVYTWKSSNGAVASVDSEGRVTAKKAGKVTITVCADEALRRSEGLKTIASASVQLTITNPNYTPLKLSNLEDSDLAAKGGSASRMSAVYKEQGTNLSASGTLKYTQNCAGYLGSDGSSYESGYFLAFRMTVPKNQFNADGYVSLTYLDDRGEPQEAVYQSGQIPEDGNIDVILNMNSRPQSSRITVAVSPQNVKYYYLDLSALQLEAGGRLGEVTEPENSYGIKTSSPIVRPSKEDLEAVDVMYHSVAWSTGVAIPGADNGKSQSNYAVLKVEAPKSMENTGVICSVSENSLEKEIVYYKIDEDENGKYALFVLDAAVESDKKALEGVINVTWAMDKGGTPIHQKLHYYMEDNNAYFEASPEGAVLPKSLAFNGLSTSMYVGQSQNVSITINKRYESELVRLSYSSSDSSVISVNRVTGKIDALKAGTATITVEAIVADSNDTVSKSAKITVKNITAPKSVKISNLKDTTATVSWARNTTGQGFEVLAVPYSEEMGKKAADWKSYIEKTVRQGGSTEGWITAVHVEETRADIEGLQANTSYIFYVKNIAESDNGTVWYIGAVSGKITTKKAIFEKVSVVAQDSYGNLIEGTDFELRGEDKPGQAGIPARITYQFRDNMGNPMPSNTVFTSMSYKSSNAKVIKIDKNGRLSLGGQAGRAELFVKGKDASGTMRTSDVITMTVRKVPSKLKEKTTTLTIGQTITLKELIGYNVSGSVMEIETDQVDFEAMWTRIEATKCFVRNNEAEGITGTTQITAANLLSDKNGITVPVTLKDGNTILDTKNATIKVNALKAPTIKSVAVKDTSAVITFTPSSTVKELRGDQYYYTAEITDKVTNKPLQSTAQNVTFEEAVGSTAEKPVYTCSVEGLSPNKKYELKVTAHYDAEISGEKIKNDKQSQGKSFTTKKRLMTPDDTIAVSYISMTELKKDTNGIGEAVFAGAVDSPDYGHIYLENNETYVLTAQVSNLARALGTDKLKWTISSGDKKSASLKTSSSTFEVQLKAVKTGTFTVTAVSTATKNIMAAFTVTITPYQSGSRGGGVAVDPIPTAYLSIGMENPFHEEKRKSA